MRRVSASTHVGLEVALLFLSASITAGQTLHAQTAAATPPPAAAATAPTLAPHEFYVFCVSDPSAPTIYFSEVFAGSADPTKQVGVSFQAIGNNFLAFLKHKYSFKSSASCAGRMSTSPQALGSKQQTEDQFRKANKQIVETRWKNQ